MKLVVLSVAVLLLHAAAAYPHRNGNATDQSLTDFLVTSLLNFKSKMKEGIPELHVPILDPYAMDPLELSEDKGSTKVNIAINDTLIHGLSDFEITKFKADPKTLEAQIELTFDKIRGEGVYELDGVVYGIFPLSGDGPYWVEGKKISARGHASLLKINNTYLQIEELVLDLQANTINGHFDNILGGGDLGEIVNSVLNQFGKRILDHYIPTLSKAVTDSFKHKVNDEMIHVPIGSLIPAN